MPAIAPELLGQLSHLQQLLCLLAEDLPDADFRRAYHPDLPPIGWYLGEAAWIEAWWLHDQVAGRHGAVAPLAPLYGPEPLPLPERGPHLPPQEELLRFARAWFDESLMTLANPGLLPEHPLLEGGFLVHYLIQHHAQAYESMLMVRAQRAAREAPAAFPVLAPLRPMAPDTATHEIPRGHYRIGAPHPATALDVELPPQAVELSAFRIAVNPVRNGEYLAFMEAGGYSRPEFWSEAGQTWLGGANVEAPDGWRRNGAGHWFGIGVNGAYALAGEAPVLGLCRHEAEAYAAWAATTSPKLAGARLPHEYQWESACRLGSLDGVWQVREWCANPFEPYAGFQPRPAAPGTGRPLPEGLASLRGGSLHAQPAVRRPSFRHAAPAGHRHLFAGLRLVLPPSQ